MGRSYWCMTASLLAALIGITIAHGAPPLYKDSGGISTSRNLSQGILMSDASGYQDQPYCVVSNGTGCFVCLITTAVREGDPGESVMSLRSCDGGVTWSNLTAVESGDDPSKPAAYGTPIQSLVSNRIYAVYSFNEDGVTTLPNGDKLHRWDYVGRAFSMRWTDDDGQTWSTERIRVPLRPFALGRNNVWHGDQQMFWTVAKASFIGGNTYIGYAIIGEPGYQPPVQCVVLKSPNLLTAQDPHDVTWSSLPEGDYGLMPPTDNLGEEGHTIEMEGMRGAVFYRTQVGYLSVAYSNDGFVTFEESTRALYKHNGNQWLKNPRGPTQIHKFTNGKYLMLFYNNGATGYANRTPYWLIGGKISNGNFEWSQPEIALYEWHSPSERGPGYPDFIDFKGKIFITETQKVESRIHQINPNLLQVLWDFDNKNIPTDGLILSVAPAKPQIPAPYFPDLEVGGGFSFGLWIQMSDFTPGQVLLNNKQYDSAKGFAFLIGTNQTLVFTLTTDWLHLDRNILTTDDICGADLFDGNPHHIGVVVDGASKVITLVVDDILCDGGTLSQQGWQAMSDSMSDANSYELLNFGPFNGQFRHLRIWDRFLYTNDLIGIWRAERSQFHTGHSSTVNFN